MLKDKVIQLPHYLARQAKFGKDLQVWLESISNDTSLVACDSEIFSNQIRDL